MKNKRLFSIFSPGILAVLLILAAALVFFALKNQQKSAQENLAAFNEMTSLDPLFYSPFFDQKNFDEAINGLAESENILKKSIVDNLKLPTNANEAWHVPVLKDTPLFPFQFLRDLSVINRKTDEFLKNPSPKQARNLLALYDDAADAYLEGVSNLISGLEQTERKKLMDSYFFFTDSVSSVNVAKNDLSTIRANGYALKEEIKKRRKCLLDKTFCRVSAAKDNGSFVDSLNADFNLKGEKIDFIKNTLPAAAQDKIKGPYKIASPCWQGADSKHWLYLIYAAKDNKSIVIPKLADQNYYQKLPPRSEAKTNEILLLEKNINFVRRLEANTYQCLDLNFYPLLLALDFIKDRFGAKKITIGDFNENPGYRLLAENQFGLIAPAINRVSDNLKTLKINLLINKATVSPEYLFSVRSSYSIFYFPFARSIWRADRQLQYFIPKEDAPLNKESGYFTLDQLEKMGYSKKEIERFNVNTAGLLELFKASPESQSLK
ncbi:MAG: hypothetical protein PHT44_00665 [Candidatus Portnoybacteria bacterium]|nr:hypothetical protein [Candidatus Portnoybacteria bacterium]MDD4982873.1 hypothetical protein [Candidatus Portnoybacteria bacterium]